MATCVAPKERELYETGTEPEYTINSIMKYEEAGNGLIRVYISSSRKNYERLEYTILASPETLSRLSRTIMAIAAEFQEVARFRKALTEH